MGAMSPNPFLRPGQVVTGGSGGAESNLFWALVYVPQGTTAGALNVATAGGDGRSGSAESNLFWALVYVLKGQLQGHSTSQQQAQLQAACTNPTSLS